jgi:hypothetical protein
MHQFRSTPAVDGRRQLVCHLKIVDKEKSCKEPGREPIRTLFWTCENLTDFMPGSEAGLLRRAAGKWKHQQGQFAAHGTKPDKVDSLLRKANHVA